MLGLIPTRLPYKITLSYFIILFSASGADAARSYQSVSLNSTMLGKSAWSGGGSTALMLKNISNTTQSISVSVKQKLTSAICVGRPSGMGSPSSGC